MTGIPDKYTPPAHFALRNGTVALLDAVNEAEDRAGGLIGKALLRQASELRTLNLAAEAERIVPAEVATDFAVRLLAASTENEALRGVIAELVAVHAVPSDGRGSHLTPEHMTRAAAAWRAAEAAVASARRKA